MADAQVETATITIPGTQTKVPRRTMLLVLGVLAVIVLAFLTRRKAEPEAEPEDNFSDLGLDDGPQPVTLQRIGPGASPGDMTSAIAPPIMSTQPVAPLQPVKKRPANYWYTVPIESLQARLAQMRAIRAAEIAGTDTHHYSGTQGRVDNLARILRERLAAGVTGSTPL